MEGELHIRVISPKITRVDTGTGLVALTPLAGLATPRLSNWRYLMSKLIRKGMYAAEGEQPVSPPPPTFKGTTLAGVIEFIRTYHTTVETGRYDCIGFSEGQQCCVDKLKEKLGIV